MQGSGKASGADGLAQIGSSSIQPDACNVALDACCLFNEKCLESSLIVDLLDNLLTAFGWAAIWYFANDSRLAMSN